MALAVVAVGRAAAVVAVVFSVDSNANKSTNSQHGQDNLLSVRLTLAASQFAGTVIPEEQLGTAKGGIGIREL